MKNAQALKLSSNDFLSSLKKVHLWLYLGWSDIKLRFRGSALGPFWITLSMIFFVAALSLVYTRLLHQELSTFIPFLTAGMVVWTFISTVLNESSDVFVLSKSFIDNIKLPYLIYIFRLIWRNQIIFLHNIVVFVLVAVIFKVPINANTLLFFPGFVLVSLGLTCVSTIIAILGTRFRDIPQVITSIVMLVFFVSPVTWPAEMIGQSSLIIMLNPLSYALDVVRSPLLGQAPQLQSWVVCLGLLCFLFVWAAALFTKYRSRIAYWV